MNLLILGATGGTGRELVRQAVARGHGVTALARDPAKAAFAPLVRTMQGSLADAASLDAALHGQEAVLSAVGTGLSRAPTTQLSDGTRALVAAMDRAGVRRLVLITGIGAGDSRGHGGFLYNHVIQPLLLAEIYKDKTRQEAVLRASDLDWTVVRPAMLTSGPAVGVRRVAVDLTGFQASKIARADVAAFMLDELEKRAYVRATPVISN